MTRKLWAVCDDDNIQMIISMHPDADPDAQIPDQGEWSEFVLSCPVCGGALHYDEDPTSVDDDITWHRRSAGKRTVMNLLEFMSQDNLLAGLKAACEFYEIDPERHGVDLSDRQQLVSVPIITPEDI